MICLHSGCVTELGGRERSEKKGREGKGRERMNVCNVGARHVQVEGSKSSSGYIHPCKQSTLAQHHNITASQ